MRNRLRFKFKSAFRAGIRSVLATRALHLALVAATLLHASTARANPRALPFTYNSETLAKGQTEVEQYADLSPVRGLNDAGKSAWYNSFQLQTEYEHGLTDALELGLYVAFGSTPPSGFSATAQVTEGTALKQRLRWRLADVGAWPIDVAMYAEIVEKQQELELEGKLILQRRFGPARLAVNAWFEREFYFDGKQETVVHPTAGLTIEVRRWFHVGAEWWLVAELPKNAFFNSGPHQYVGPTMMVELEKLWWCVGAYYRLNDIDRNLDPGDGYGHYWFRTIIGLEL